MTSEYKKNYYKSYYQSNKDKLKEYQKIRREKLPNLWANMDPIRKKIATTRTLMSHLKKLRRLGETHYAGKLIDSVLIEKQEDINQLKLQLGK